jgi:hypothetical protein
MSQCITRTINKKQPDFLNFEIFQGFLSSFDYKDAYEMALGEEVDEKPGQLKSFIMETLRYCLCTAEDNKNHLKR